MIKVDGKTGVRPIRIVKSVPYLTRWLNDHPDKDDHTSPLWDGYRCPCCKSNVRSKFHVKRWKTSVCA